MQKKVSLLLYDLLMIVGIILIIIGGITIYFEQDEQQTNDREVVYSTSEVELQSPELIIAEEREKKISEEEIIEIEIPAGTSILEIAQIMEENDLIEAQEFLWLIEEFDVAQRIRAGSYQFSPQVDMEEIFDHLILPDSEEVNNND